MARKGHVTSVMARKGHMNSELTRKGRTTATGRRQHRPQATQAVHGNAGAPSPAALSRGDSKQMLGTVSLIRVFLILSDSGISETL